MNRLFKMAIRLGVTNAVQLYVAKGIDVNATDDGGMSPLMYAADAGQFQICLILLEAGADPQQCNAEGRDAHFLALKNGSPETVSILRKLLGNRAEENLEKTGVSQSGVDESAIDYADLAAMYHREGFDISGWEEFAESNPPPGDPMVDSAAGNVQSLISLHVAPDTDEDWSEIKLDLPNVDDFLNLPDSQFQEGTRKPGSRIDSSSARSQIYILEVGGSYLTCHPSVFAKYRTGLHEQKTLSTADLSALRIKILTDVELLNRAESGRRTVWLVVKAIVSRQQDFLAKGPKHLKPMMLREIAEEVEIHESTVSRIVNRIQAHTPHGIIPLRTLFSGFVLNEHGQEISTQAIKLRVKELLMQDLGTNPITDEQIVNWLKGEDVKISRRTVAKYRKQLQILGSRQRPKRIGNRGVWEAIEKKAPHDKAESSWTESLTISQVRESRPRKENIEEMGKRYFGEEAIGAQKYERAIELLHPTILCGYRPAESYYQFGQAHLEIVSRRIPSLSPKECKGEDIKLHLAVLRPGFVIRTLESGH